MAHFISLSVSSTGRRERGLVGGEVYVHAPDDLCLKETTHCKVPIYMSDNGDHDQIMSVMRQCCRHG